MNHPQENLPKQANSSLDVILEQGLPQQPQVPRQNKYLIGWCRFILWISPGPLLLIIVLGGEWLGLKDAHAPLLLIGGFICACGMGYCDSFLLSISQKNRKPDPEEAVKHALIFGLLQIIVAPFVLLVIGLFMTIAANIYIVRP